MARGVTATAIADSVLRLAVLLQAGVAPARAWAYLAEAGDDHAARVCAASATGMPLAAAIASSDTASPSRRRLPSRPPQTGSGSTSWRDVAAAWQVATAVGAPLAESLRALSLALRDAQEAADDVRVALAEPAATARLMGWLPLVAVLLGHRARVRHVRNADRQPDRHRVPAARCSVDLRGAEVERGPGETVPCARRRSPACDEELLAIALSGGVSIDRARRLVHEATGSTTDAATDAVLDLSRSAGVPAVELLRASSTLARHRARVEGRLRAARLSTRLLLPLGVCTLPAFLLLGVAPMLLSVMTSVPLPLTVPTDRAHRPCPPICGRNTMSLTPLTRRRAARLFADDTGAATAEYAIATMAAVAFAGLLVVIMRSDEVRGILTDLIRRALTVA